jgi:hypothetical protein
VLVRHPRLSIATKQGTCQSQCCLPAHSPIECVPADVARIHDEPQSCSSDQASNSPGKTGLRT